MTLFNIWFDRKLRSNKMEAETVHFFWLLAGNIRFSFHIPVGYVVCCNEESLGNDVIRFIALVDGHVHCDDASSGWATGPIVFASACYRIHWIGRKADWKSFSDCLFAERKWEEVSGLTFDWFRKLRKILCALRRISMKWN